MIHVYPLNDEREHVLEGTDCPCKPEIRWQNLTGEIFEEPLCMHHAFDGREVLEEAARILRKAGQQ